MKILKRIKKWFTLPEIDENCLGPGQVHVSNKDPNLLFKFECEKCGKSFTTIRGLKIHIGRMHQ
jgi:hypothetical protein